jgi:predicted nucleic acid-binding protein
MLFTDGVSIPEAVWREVVTEGGDRPGVRDIETASWLHVVHVQNADFVFSLSRELDAGEAEAIALFREQPCAAILLDEKDARSVAMTLAQPVLGTVGVMLWARQKALIPSLRGQLDALQSIGGFRLGAGIRRAVLRRAGEIEA